jgi:hypothetical protein
MASLCDEGDVWTFGAMMALLTMLVLYAMGAIPQSVAGVALTVSATFLTSVNALWWLYYCRIKD